MRRILGATLTLSALGMSLGLGLVPAPAAAQSAAEILNTALDRHDARTRGIRNYTVVQQVMGVETTMYFERRAMDGREVFQPVAARAGGQDVPVGTEGGWNPHTSFSEIADRARYTGTETVGGHRSHVLRIDDFSGLAGMAQAAPGQQGGFEARTGRMYIDASDYVLRQMVIEGTATIDGEQQPVTMEARFEDYRDIQGLLHPFRTVIRTTGLTANVSQADLEEARRSMVQLEEQMASMPEAQRRMMERVVRPQMQQLQNILAGEAVEITTEVTDVRVNTGPPAAR
jgi:hypothetical protein